MTINELRDKRNKLLHDAQDVLLNAPDAEKRASAHLMLNDADAIEKDIAALEKIETAEREERSRTAPVRSQPGADNGTDKGQAERRAFENYIRFGFVDNNVLRENRDVVGLTTGSTTGGQMVPQNMHGILQEALKSYGQILNVVNVVNVDNGSPTKVALVNDTGSLMYEMTEDNSTAATEVDPTLDSKIITCSFLSTGVLKVSMPELSNSAFDIDSFVKNSFGKRYARGLSQMVVTGSTSGNIASIVTGSYLGATQADPTKTVTWSDITALYGALDPAYSTNASWSMNVSTRATLLGVTDSLGRPLYITSPNAGAFDSILGRPVNIVVDLDNAAQSTTDQYPILFGDHSAYQLRVVKGGPAILRLDQRYADVGAIGYIGYVQAGGCVLDPGTHPILKYKVAKSS